ncbi:hypothetical protein ACWENA_03940 [Streptomyces sp. NPDC004779]
MSIGPSTTTPSPGRERSRLLHGVTALAGSLLLAAAITACGGAGTGSREGAVPSPVKAANADSRATAHERPAPRIITRGAGDGFPSLYAHLSGTLVVTRDNCLAVSSSRSGEPTAVVWGHGWSVRAEKGEAAVYDADGRLFAREGDQVGLGGGSTGRFAGEPCAAGQVFEANDTQAAPRDARPARDATER